MKLLLFLGVAGLVLWLGGPVIGALLGGLLQLAIAVVVVAGLILLCKAISRIAIDDDEMIALLIARHH